MEWMEWMEWVEGVTPKTADPFLKSKALDLARHPLSPHSIHSTHSIHSITVLPTPRVVETVVQPRAVRGLER